MKISVIVPVFNAAGYLESCLQSAVVSMMRTTQVSYELLCVDDGSTDRSHLLLDEFADKHSSSRISIRVWHQVNRGVASARNLGLENMTADWFVFLDADDLVSEKYFSYLVSAICQVPDADMVRVSTTAFEDGAKPIWSGDGAVHVLDISSELPGQLAMFGFTEMAYRATKFNAIRFEEFRVGEDLVYSAQCFATANRIAVINAVAYGYRLRMGSRMHGQMTAAFIEGQVQYLTRMFNIFSSCHKKIAPEFYRSRGNALIENSGAVILGRCFDSEWRQCWYDWLESLRKVRDFVFWTRWQHFVINLVLMTRSRLVAAMVCWIPYKLKRLGFHR